MTFSEFESAYFDFDISFQQLLEDLSLLDTFSLDTVEVDFEAKQIELNWRDSHQIFKIKDIDQKVSLLQELLPQAQKFNLNLSGNLYQKLSPKQKQISIDWLTDQLKYIFLEG